MNAKDLKEGFVLRDIANADKPFPDYIVKAIHYNKIVDEWYIYLYQPCEDGDLSLRRLVTVYGFSSGGEMVGWQLIKGV